jgi:hypothetical protein
MQRPSSCVPGSERRTRGEPAIGFIGGFGEGVVYTAPAFPPEAPSTLPTLQLLYPMILGLERIESTQLLRRSGVFQYSTGPAKLSGRYQPALVPAARRSESASLICALCRTVSFVDSWVVHDRRRESSSTWNGADEPTPGLHPRSTLRVAEIKKD